MPTFEEYIATLSAAQTVNISTDKVVLFQSGAAKTCNPDDLSSGGTATVTAKTADFTANGASGTIYTNQGATGTVVATLQNSAVGTSYTFFVHDSFEFQVVPVDGHTFTWFKYSDQLIDSATGASGLYALSSSVGATITVTKISATHWNFDIKGFAFND